MVTSVNHLANFKNALNCPVNFTPLVDAVQLPCGHTISEVAAKVIKADPSPDQRICSVCKAKFEIYTPNYVMRSLVASILGLKVEEAFATVSAEMQTDDTELPFELF